MCGPLTCDSLRALGTSAHASPDHKDKCSDEELKELDELLKMSADDLDKRLKETQAEMDKLGTDFEEFVKGLQKSYEEAQSTKEEKENALAPKLKMLFAAAKGAKAGKDEL